MRKAIQLLLIYFCVILIGGCESNNEKKYSKCAVLIPPDFWKESGCRIKNGKVLDPEQETSIEMQ